MFEMSYDKQLFKLCTIKFQQMYVMRNWILSDFFLHLHQMQNRLPAMHFLKHLHPGLGRLLHYYNIDRS